MTTSVALIGANGHGRTHREHLTSLQEAGAVRLVALADVRPIEPDPAGVPVFTDHRELLAGTRPDVVVICTPPHTHLPIARDAFAAGCDVLLEKPPVRTLAEHHSLLVAARAAKRACQVGFQALGSTASDRLGAAITGGDLGPVTRVATVGSWQREDSYYARAPWAGRRQVGGRPVVDGALVNPLAHALMQALDSASAAGAGAPARIAVERYRTREIEVDDTTFARITFASGLRMIAAVTLAGEDLIAGEVIVDGRAGRAVLEYPTDRLALPGDPELRSVPGRVDLLENLLAHRADRRMALIAPLERTAAFTAVLESLTALALPAPQLLDDPYVESRGEGSGRVQVIRGVNAVLRTAARTGRLPSESGVEWAVTPYSAPIPPI
jgi:predicted dehydrogenase